MPPSSSTVSFLGGPCNKMEIKHNGALGNSTKKISLVTGIILISLGFILCMQFDVLYDYIIKTAMDFNPQSDSYKAWLTNDPPMLVDYYLFNWTNAEECLLYRNCTKFKFQEVGPYSFYEIKDKVNVTWHSNNTISFKSVKRYYFNQERSRKLTDVIVNINPVAVSFAYKMRFSSKFVKWSLSFGMFPLSKLIATKTVRELLFEGYEDHILNTGSLLDNDVPQRFAYFYKKNNTISKDEMLMHFAVDEDFGKLLLVNGKNKTSYYDGMCGQVHGSSGEFLPINSEPTFIEIFSPELCSYARLDYERNVSIKGIDAYKYGSRSLFDNGTLHPENSCFCNGECLPTGVQNVTLCRQNSPIFLSLPHFYNADPYYLSKIEGLRPDKEKHELYLTVEPKSSIVMDIALRMQINMLLQPIDGITMFEKVPKLMVPLFYFDQVLTLEDEVMERIKAVQQLPEFAKIGSIGMIISGGVMIGIAILLFVFVREKKDDIFELKKMSSS